MGTTPTWVSSARRRKSHGERTLHFLSQITDRSHRYYTWSPWPTNNTGIEFVPMLWGKDQINDFTSTLGNTLTSNQVSAALAFNEPQQSGQSNLSPEDGASMWKEYIEPLKAKGLRLGSPAPSSAPNGKTWLQDFLAACNGGCTVDFIALRTQPQLPRLLLSLTTQL